MPSTANGYTFPVPTEFYGIEQKLLPMLVADGPFFEMFPFRNINKPMVTWEQWDNFYGLMRLRGYNGEPKRVNKIGRSQYNMVPGVYGDFEPIDEKEMTEAKQFATVNDSIDVMQQAAFVQRQLLQRRLQRIQWILSTLVIQGQFTVTNENGNVVHSDGYQRRVYTAPFAWSNPGSSTPLADMRAMQLMHRGYSVRFDRTSEMIVNQTQANYALVNTNPADLYGRRTSTLQTINTLADLNKLFNECDLPSLRVYDKEYYDDNQVLNLWVPTGVGILVGKRESGVPVGGFAYTRNLVNAGGGPGPYTRINTEKMMWVPPILEVHDGFNGGPILEFPSAIVVALI